MGAWFVVAVYCCGLSSSLGVATPFCLLSSRAEVMKIISGYIRRSVIQSTLLCLLVLIGVQCFINLINISGDLGKGSLTLGMAVLVVLMKLPADLYQMFPMVGFVGCLLGLGRLSFLKIE